MRSELDVFSESGRNLEIRIVRAEGRRALNFIGESLIETNLQRQRELTPWESDLFETNFELKKEFPLKCRSLTPRAKKRTRIRIDQLISLNSVRDRLPVKLTGWLSKTLRT